jgi:hypothetical protein
MLKHYCTGTIHMALSDRSTQEHCTAGCTAARVRGKKETFKESPMKTLWRFSHKIFWVLAMMVLTNLTMAGNTLLQFETQELDLDTGKVSEAPIPGDINNSEADILISYNADRTPHAVVVGTGSALVIAVLVGTPFDAVASKNLAGLDLSAPAMDTPFGFADTVIVQTANGAVFKLGNAQETEAGVSFDYARLQ